MQPGFTVECKKTQRIAEKLKRKWQKLETEEAWKAFCKARNFKGKIIKKKTKKQYQLENEVAFELSRQI